MMQPSANSIAICFYKEATAMYLSNKYTTWYYQIIISAQHRSLPQHLYTEKHHIIPRSLGGDNSPENLVKLTAREHFVCHLLLCKMTEGNARAKMLHAAWMLANIGNHVYKSSRIYQKLREDRNKNYSGKNHPYYGKKRPEHSIAVSGEKNYFYGKHFTGEKNGFFGKKHTLESIAKANESRKITNWRPSKEMKAKWSSERSGEGNSFYGKKHSIESLNKMKEACKNRPEDFYSKLGKILSLRPKLACPYCGKIVDERNAKRWHFDRCKLFQQI